MPCPERIYERQAHKQSHSYTNGSNNHGTANVNTAAGV